MISLLLARLALSVYYALTRRFLISKVLRLTESAIMLAWIQSEKRQYKQSIQNKEVRKLTKRDMWYHLPRKGNIAYLSWRECLPEELSSKRSN